jgi:FMN phosphatase YigB (HAD superfamily)
MAEKAYLEGNQSFIFDLDNVIYPERDYLLQVYYLFAHFMEYTLQLNAAEMVDYMKIEYESSGSTGLFEKTATRFNIPGEYKENFDLLHRTAQLPLKLLVFEPVMQFLQDLVVERKQLFLLVSGDPEQQLNKIRQLEWQGLGKYLRVFFSEEIAAPPFDAALQHLLDSHKLNPKETLLIGVSTGEEALAVEAGINYLNVDKLFLN